MKEIQPHLVFDGECAEAMEFYRRCLGGELFILPYEKSPVPELKTVKNRVLHATLRTPGAELRGSDSHPDQRVRRGDNILIFLQCADAPEAERVFTALSEKGAITMPLQKTFFAVRFGTLVDRFGVHWKVSTAN